MTNRSRASRAAKLRPDGAPRGTCWRRLCVTTSSIDTGPYSATGSPDVGCAGIAVAESSTTVARKGCRLRCAWSSADAQVIFMLD
jgi:hypothetical protein